MTIPPSTKYRQEITKILEQVILIDAVNKFNATPVVGEAFDMKRLNAINQALNDHGSYLYNELKDKFVKKILSLISASHKELIKRVNDLEHDRMVDKNDCEDIEYEAGYYDCKEQVRNLLSTIEKD